MKLQGQSAQGILAALLVTVSISLALVLVRPPSPLAGAEQLIDALAFRVFAPPPSPRNDVAIIAITEETLSRFPYRSPVDRAFLAQLVDTLSAAAPAAIGLDVVIDRPTEPEKDAALRGALRRSTSPVVLVTLTPEATLAAEQRRYLEAFTTSVGTGYANLARDRFDLVVREHVPRHNETGMLSFPAALAVAAGASTPDTPFQIDWRPPPLANGSSFPVYPAEAVSLLPQDWLRGKVLLVGSLVPGADEHRTLRSAFGSVPSADGLRQLGSAFGKPTFGVEIHAHVVSQIIEGRVAASRPRFWRALGASTVLAVIGAATATQLAGWIMVASLSALMVLFWAGALAAYSLGGPLVSCLAPTLALTFASGGVRLWRGRSDRRDRQVLRQLFSRFVSEPVVTEILREREAFLAGGRPRPHELTATVLFSDIAGFTTICEKLAPVPLIAWLDRYIDTMVQLIMDHQGVVLRFVGDGILAVFGAPIARTTPEEIATDARNAAQCALAMERAMQELNEGWRAAGLPVAGIRVGIHTGPLVAGSLGNGPHMEYCLLGDTANVAARLEALGKQYTIDQVRDCVILVGEPTWQRLDKIPGAMPVGEIALRGRRQKTAVYRIDTGAAAQASLPPPRIGLVP